MTEAKKEPKASRTVAEINQEYSNLCTKAGHTQYTLYVLAKDLELINEQLKNLNFEHAAATKAEAEAKASKEAAEKAAAAPPAPADTSAPQTTNQETV